MKNYKESKIWSDRFLSEMKRILGVVFIKVAPLKDDMELNTDLIMPNGARVSCRIRSCTYMEQYFGQFTIRTLRPSGTKSELDKIRDGWGDFILYGYANREGTGLAYWFIGDLEVFRNYLKSYMEQNQGNLPGTEHMNRDNSSLFRAFSLEDIPGFVIASSENI